MVLARREERPPEKREKAGVGDIKHYILRLWCASLLILLCYISIIFFIYYFLEIERENRVVQ